MSLDTLRWRVCYRRACRQAKKVGCPGTRRRGFAKQRLCVRGKRLGDQSGREPHDLVVPSWERCGGSAESGLNLDSRMRCCVTRRAQVMVAAQSWGWRQTTVVGSRPAAAPRPVAAASPDYTANLRDSRQHACSTRLGCDNTPNQQDRAAGQRNGKARHCQRREGPFQGGRRKGVKGEFRRPPGVGRQPDCLLLANPTPVGRAVAEPRRMSG